MEQEQKKKRKLKLKFKIIIIIFLIILYAFLIGTKGIFIKDIVIESNNINNDLNGVKILQFSDVHYGSNIKEKQIKKLVKKINETKPDIVIFTGDLIDDKYEITNEEIEFLKKQLKKIKCEYGKYYIFGEEDSKDAQSILNYSEFVNLNSGEQIIYINKSNLLLIDKENSKNYFSNNPEISHYKILALHNPNDFDNLKNYDYQLAIAGHTHNGQINIPKIKDLIIDGKYKKTYQKVNNTKLFVNPGIGNSNISARLFNHPTIYLYRLKNTPNNQ